MRVTSGVGRSVDKRRTSSVTAASACGGAAAVCVVSVSAAFFPRVELRVARVAGVAAGGSSVVRLRCRVRDVRMMSAIGSLGFAHLGCHGLVCREHVEVAGTTR